MTNKSKRQYWTYTPGDKACMWEEFYREGIMGLRCEWNELGDFRQYENKDAFKEILGEQTKASMVNVVNAFWQFSKEMKIGDVIFAKKGLNKIIGRGIVVSDYIYDKNYGDYQHLRRVKWINYGQWEFYAQFALKTLTNITPYEDYCSKLDELFAKVDNFVPYTKADFLEEVYFEEESYEDLKKLLFRKKNVILQGSPGVGKTFISKRLSYALMGEKDDSRVKMVQFHQSYSYEDFIMGYRPYEKGFFLRMGCFYEFCQKACRDKREHFFIIDEINRGNISKIFGELLMLIEADKRGEEYALSLVYGTEKFFIPPNLYIIGIMNTADRSLAMLDYALRRRFGFFDISPCFLSDGFKKYQDRINNKRFDKIVEKVIKLNSEIMEDYSLGSGFRIGHSYFCNFKDWDEKELLAIIDYEIIPLLKEYWFDQMDRVEHWEKILKGILNE